MPERGRIDQQRVAPLAVADGADVGEVELLESPEVLDERARRSNRGGAVFEPEPFEPADLQLIEQRPARRFGVERPAIDAGDRDRGQRRRRQAVGQIDFGRYDDLARLEYRNFVDQRRWPVSAVILGDGELAGREIEQGRADDVVGLAHRSAGGAKMGQHRHQERRFARVQVAGVGQRAGRDDADDFALDESLGLARILDLVANRDAKTLFHEPGDVAVDGVERHAAHRDPAAVGVFGPGGERQFEGASGYERIFVEHLVEVAHAEEQDGVAVLPLRVEILTHRRRRRRGHIL